MTKHEEIIKYIYSLKVGTKISVRTIANDLNVSDGTAYRAIKDSEEMGIVSTVPRVGTLRIEKLEKKNEEKLTFAEVDNIVNGSVLGGRDGLHKTLNKFIIGAMTVEGMKKYISPGNLLIVGNREEAQRLAIENGCAVLITGGFSCSDEIRNLANKKQLPIISCTYDTFTVATLINKAISENMIKKDIILVEDIMKTDTAHVKTDSTIGELKELMRKTRNAEFPVLDDNDKVVGIITIKDLKSDATDDSRVAEYMTKDPITVSPRTSVAYVAHIMIWEGIECIPVIAGKRLIGIVNLQEVMRALQSASKQPQIVETVDDIVLKGFNYINTNAGMKFTGKITPEMLNPIGTASWNSLTMLMSTAGTLVLTQKYHMDIAVDYFTVLFIKPVQVDSEIEINTNILDMGRNNSKIEIEITSGKKQQLVGKALLSAKILRK